MTKLIIPDLLWGIKNMTINNYDKAHMVADVAHLRVLSDKLEEVNTQRKKVRRKLIRFIRINKDHPKLKQEWSLQDKLKRNYMHDFNDYDITKYVEIIIEDI